MSSHDVVEIVSVQFSQKIVNIRNTLRYYMLFAPNKFYAYLLYYDPSNLIISRIYNLEFDDIEITFTDQNGGFFKIEDKVDITLFIKK